MLIADTDESPVELPKMRRDDSKEDFTVLDVASAFQHAEFRGGGTEDARFEAIKTFFSLFLALVGCSEEYRKHFMK